MNPKYHKTIYGVLDDKGKSILIDIYKVQSAFNVICGCRAQALKKILMPGQRGKGTEREDLVGAIQAIEGAIRELDDRELRAQAEMKQVRAKWERAFGKLDDPATQAAIQTTIEAMKAVDSPEAVRARAVTRFREAAAAIGLDGDALLPPELQDAEPEPRVDITKAECFTPHPADPVCACTPDVGCCRVSAEHNKAHILRAVDTMVDSFQLPSPEVPPTVVFPDSQPPAPAEVAPGTSEPVVTKFPLAYRQFADKVAEVAEAKPLTEEETEKLQATLEEAKLKHAAPELAAYAPQPRVKASPEALAKRLAPVFAPIFGVSAESLLPLLTCEQLRVAIVQAHGLRGFVEAVCAASGLTPILPYLEVVQVICKGFPGIEACDAPQTAPPTEVVDSPAGAPGGIVDVSADVLD